MTFQLFNYFRSSASYRVRIALHYKKIEFQYLPIHLLKSEQHSPKFRIINASGEVPVLVHEGQRISQSVAIVEYLNELYPTPPLYPVTPAAKAKVRQLCEGINCTHPLHSLRVVRYLESQEHFDQAQKDRWAIHWIKENLEAHELFLRDVAGQFSVGDEFTAADLFLVPQVFTSQRLGVDLTPYPTIRKVYENCLDLECVKNSHPHMQVDTPEELRGKYV